MVEEILNKLDLSSNNIIIRRRYPNNSITWHNFVEVMIKCKDIKSAAIILNYKHNSLSDVINKKVFPALSKPKNVPYRQFFLGAIGLRACSTCDIISSLDSFYKASKGYIGYGSICKKCDRSKLQKYRIDNEEQVKIKSKAYYIKYKDRYSEWRRLYYQNNKPAHFANSAKRRAAKLQRTVEWADLDKIKEIYKNCPEGYHVDHIIPLQGKNVSGLHVENNLQYLLAKENLSKGNKYEQ